MPVFRASPPQLSPEALKRLGLKRQPFAPPQECDALYRGTALDMLCNSLVQQLAAGDKIHVVKGERGIGKTTFCRRLLCDAPEDMALTLFTAARRRTVNDVFRALSDGVTEAGGSDTQTLATYAAQSVFRVLRAGRQPVLLVDDAHLLRVPTLRMILRFQQAIEKQGAGRLNLVLLGERAIDDKLGELDTALPDETRLHSQLLRPLNRNEVADYLAFRLKAAGGGHAPFSGAHLQQLQQQGGGLPGKIDRIACDLLNGGKRGSRLSHPAVFGALAVAAAALAGVYYSGKFNEHAPERPAKPARSDAKPRPDNAESAVRPPADPVPAAEPESAPPAVPDDGFLIAAEPEALSFDLGAGNEDESGGTATPGAPAPDAAPAEADEPGTGATGDPVHDPGDTGGDAPEASAGADPVTDSRAWLQQWPLDYYVVQLAGAWNRERLAAEADRYSLDWPLVVHETDRNGRSWYILLYGAFPDADTAREAAGRLPPELRGDQPWPRPVGTLLAK